MKILTFLIVVFLYVGQGYTQFIINGDPQNPTRKPDPSTEMGVILQRNSPTITVGSGSGEKTSNYLPSGVLVIVDKGTGYAKWVGACGNIIFTKWKPQGKIVYFENPGSYQDACIQMLKALEFKIANVQVGINKLLARPPSLTLPKPKNVRGSWSVEKTALTALATSIGFAAGGYAFQRTENRIRTTVIPGVGAQTDNGTWTYGPDHLKVETYETKNFNWGAAVLSGLVSGVITSLLNYLVF